MSREDKVGGGGGVERLEGMVVTIRLLGSCDILNPSN